MRNKRKLLSGLLLLFGLIICLPSIAIGLWEVRSSTSEPPKGTPTPPAQGNMAEWVDGSDWGVFVDHAFGVARSAQPSDAQQDPAPTDVTIYLDVDLANRADGEEAPNWQEFVLRDADGQTHTPDNRRLGERFPFTGVIYPSASRSGRLVYLLQVPPEALEELTFILGGTRSLDRIEVHLDDFYIAERSTLPEAISSGKVSVTIQGQNLEVISLRMQSQVEVSLELEIELGTIFVPEVPGPQDMVLRQGTEVILEPDIQLELSLDVACADMHLPAPTEAEFYAIGEEPAPEDLVLLLRNPEFRQASFRLQQFAIWTITDNPAPSEYVGLGGVGIGTGPTEAELDIVRQLFEAAEVDLSTYNAFN